jgi:hypothetical protein
MTYPPPPPNDPFQPPVVGGYGAPAPHGYPVMAPPAKKSKTKLILSIVGASLVLCCGGVIAIGVASDDDKDAKTASVAAPVTTTARATITTEPVVAPTTVVPKKTAPAPKPKPIVVEYKSLTARQWKKIAKDPDSYYGDTFIVYGVVTQFDAATGTDTFRANIGAKNMSESYDYETNTMVTGPESALDDLVEDDEFRAKVAVTGSFSYETQMGGETTAPQLEVRSIKVL